MSILNFFLLFECVASAEGFHYNNASDQAAKILEDR